MNLRHGAYAADHDISTRPPDDPTFEPSNPQLGAGSVMWVKVPDTYPCAECLARGGWSPMVDPSDCPMCLGADEIGQKYCGQCEFCCGC